MMPRTMHVIGGEAGIGKWVIEHMLDTYSGAIYSYDTNPRTLLPSTSRITVCRPSVSDGYFSFREQFKSNDWILIAVPVASFKQTVKDIVPCLQEGTLVVSLSSIQKDQLELLELEVPSHSTCIGFHPLFGATVGSPVGQLAAITAFDKKKDQHREFCNFLKGKGILTSFLDAGDHDKYMAYVQALTHFCLLGFAAALGNDDAHPRDLLKLGTPNFHFLFAFASRVIKLSPTTTGAIQSTTDASMVRKALLKTMTSLHESFESARNPESYANVVRTLCNPLTGAEVDEGAEVAAIAVSSLQEFEELLHHYKESEMAFIFRHRVTNKIKIGKIIDITHDEVIFEESTRTITDNGVTRFAIGLDPIAKENYRAKGLIFPTPLKDRIKKRNIKLLKEEELKRFRHENIVPIVIDLNLENPFQLDEYDFEEWLPRVVDGLWKCDFINTFRKRGQVEKVTVRLAFNPQKRRQEIVESIRRAGEQRQLLKKTPDTF